MGSDVPLKNADVAVMTNDVARFREKLTSHQMRTAAGLASCLTLRVELWYYNSTGKETQCHAIRLDYLGPR